MCPECGTERVRSVLTMDDAGIFIVVRAFCDAGHEWSGAPTPREPTDSERIGNMEAALSGLLAWANEADAGASARTGLRDVIARFEMRRPT